MPAYSMKYDVKRTTSSLGPVFVVNRAGQALIAQVFSQESPQGMPEFFCWLFTICSMSAAPQVERYPYKGGFPTIESLEKSVAMSGVPGYAE